MKCPYCPNLRGNDVFYSPWDLDRREPVCEECSDLFLEYKRKYLEPVELIPDDSVVYE